MKSYLIDLDGTIYSGNKLINYAKDFIDYLNNVKKKYLFVTNCPLKSPEKIIIKLQKLGLSVGPDCVLSSGMAAIQYLAKKHKGEKVYLIGSDDLKSMFCRSGIELVEDKADIVLVGYDPKFTYAMMKRAVYLISCGAEYIATNADQVIPGKRYFIPHTGAIAASITEASGKQPLFIGKPSCLMFDAAIQMLGCVKNDIAMVGDRVDTDIEFAMNNGIPSYLVLTGVTKESDISSMKIRGQVRIVKNLLGIIDFDRKEDIDVY